MALNVETLKNLLIRPQETLPKLEKEKMETAIVQMVLNWILIAIAFGIMINFQLSPVVLVTGIIFNIIAALVINIALTTVGGKGTFKNALDSVTYPFFGISSILLLISLISKAVAYSSILTALFAFVSILLSLIYSVIGFVGCFRMLKESFKLDLVTVWIVTSLVTLSLILSFYITLAAIGSANISQLLPMFLRAR